MRELQNIIIIHKRKWLLYTIVRPNFHLVRTVPFPFRTEPLIVTVRFLVFDREPYRTKVGTFIRLLLRTANVPHQNEQR